MIYPLYSRINNCPPFKVPTWGCLFVLQEAQHPWYTRQTVSPFHGSDEGLDFQEGTVPFQEGDHRTRSENESARRNYFRKTLDIKKIKWLTVTVTQNKSRWKQRRLGQNVSFWASIHSLDHSCPPGFHLHCNKASFIQSPLTGNWW